MLVSALLQTSLVLWLARQTLQGGVKPQSVSWGRALPARGVGIGVKPGVVGALGAVGNRYGTKAMKAGIGRYPGAQLGVGGYRALGLGGRAGLRPGGYGTQGAYGTGLGMGAGLGTGLTNGLGTALGQGPKRAYGAGLGTLPGYGTFAGIGYPGARPGLSTAELGGPEMANLGQAAQDLKSEKGRGVPYGKPDRTPGLKMPDMRRANVLDVTSPELQTGTSFRPAILPPEGEVKSLDSLDKSSSLEPLAALDKQGISLAVPQVGESYQPVVPERRDMASLGATLATGGERQQLPLDKDGIGSLSSASLRLLRARDYDLSTRKNQKIKNCGSTSDLPDEFEINRHELLGTETQSLPPKGSKHLERATPQEERAYGLPLPQIHDARGYTGGAGNYLGASLGTGGYGPGYGDGATGYLGAMGSNGFGYGNGYGDGYGAGLGYPAELADGAENKAGKREALGTGAYAGQIPGAYGALGAGLDSNGGKYGGGAAQVPYGNAPVIPTGLEGDGYMHSPQQLALAAESAKTASKYGAAGFGGQQAGYGAQLGAAQEALGEQARKFSGVNDALGNGYKG